MSASSIEITFAYQGERCRERIKLKPTPANLKAARRHREAILHAIANGTFEYHVTFPDSTRAPQFAKKQGQVIKARDYLEQWLIRQEQRLKSSTFADYRKTMDGQLIPAFGHLPLAEVTRAAIRDFCETLTCGNKRISNILSPLRIALQEALDDDLIEINPLYSWSYRRREAVKAEDDVDPFSPDEQKAILEAMSGGGRNLIQFTLWAGLRTSELVALEWGDIDWLREEVKISRAHTQAAEAPETPKTKSGNRAVRLLPPALAALMNQKKFSSQHPSGRVFLDPRTGEPWAGDQPIRKTLWIPALKKAGVRYRRPYQTRHSYASMMLSAGESPMWVAAQMGHSDWTMIARIYGKWIPAADPTAGNKAVAAFASYVGVKAEIEPKG